MSISMLDEKLPILIRETLHDTGREKYSNASPDIIVRKNKYEEDKLVEIFTKTYDQDISLDRDGSEKMYLYVRFKNTSDKPFTDFELYFLEGKPCGPWEYTVPLECLELCADCAEHAGKNSAGFLRII